MGGPGGFSTGGHTKAQRSQGLNFCPHSLPKCSSSSSTGPEALGKPGCSEFKERRLFLSNCPVPSRGQREEWETHPSGGCTPSRPEAGWTLPCCEHLETPDRPPHSARPPGEPSLAWVWGKRSWGAGQCAEVCARAWFCQAWRNWREAARQPEV